ncbi:MAG: HTH domain-containing protein, partial [Erysipelotrichaceae bacterium]|nr:HTH domain-containing protein [Erysipelotrichaceae bacterium]
MNSRDTFVSSEQLAERTMSSVRTIKSDIAMLADALRYENIAVIESKRSQGYRLIPLDEEQFAAFAETVQIHRILFQYRSI